MSYQAEIYNVMIASPGDVDNERRIVRGIVYEWNVIHSMRRKIILLPIGWETHSFPAMGARPQKIINSQILKNCDLLVGIFWTRIGTETGLYPSGTVEEIEEHIKAGKPAMLYFSNKPAHPDSINPQQYDKLIVFKKSCQARGLYETYDSISEFKEKFFRQLQLKLNEPEFLSSLSLTQDDKNKIEYDNNNSIVPKLSKEAKILLSEASNDTNGTILFLRFLGGCELQTNGKNFITNKEHREIAKWESALNQLVSEEIVVERGYKGEVFELTSKGYHLADLIDT